MSSRFKKSLGLFKYRQSENPYRILKETEFEEKFVEMPSAGADLEENAITNMQEDESFDLRELKSFYMNIYAALRFTYEIDFILDEMEYEGISLVNAEALMSLCCLLNVNSANVMIYLGDTDFSMTEHYALCNDATIMAQNIYKTLAVYHSISGDRSVTSGDAVEITRYDQIENRLSCRYIRSGLAVMKLFHVLAILQKSPFYCNEVHTVSGLLIESLRETLFDKRIIRVVIDSDINGESDKPHKSTRIKIYFVMDNSDRYCIRLDFPHEGEESIHLNMNQPGMKQSTGFPFGAREYRKIQDECDGRVELSDLFYFSDDLYWFRSGYASTVAHIGDEDVKRKLELFMRERAHIKISSSDAESKNAVALFSSAFGEAMIEYDAVTNIYGKTDSEDESLFMYALFLDYIYDTVIKLRYHEIGNVLRAGKCCKKGADMDVSSEIMGLFRAYVHEKFPMDYELSGYANNCSDILDFFEKSIDHVEKIERK